MKRETQYSRWEMNVDSISVRRRKKGEQRLSTMKGSTCAEFCFLLFDVGLQARPAAKIPYFSQRTRKKRRRETRLVRPLMMRIQGGPPAGRKGCTQGCHALNVSRLGSSWIHMWGERGNGAVRRARDDSQLDRLAGGRGGGAATAWLGRKWGRIVSTLRKIGAR